MLGKLIKHEFKETSKVFAILYAAIIVVAALDRIFLYINSDLLFVSILQVVLSFTYGLGVVALFIMTIVLIVKRFYDNMLKDQGYLTFTLPVTTNAQVLSKLIVSFIWFILTCVATTISVVVMFIGVVEWKDVTLVVQELVSTINEQQLWGITIKIILFILIGILTSILTFYFCMSVGQLLNKHKILGAVGTYFGIYIVLQIIGTFIISTISICIDDGMLYYVDYGIYMKDWINLFMNAYLILYVVLIAIYYIGTVLILDKKLNLE